MQLLGLYVVDPASVRAPDCCPLERRAQMLYVLLVYPASVRATGCWLFQKAYAHNWVGIRLVVAVVKKYLENGVYQSTSLPCRSVASWDVSTTLIQLSLKFQWYIPPPPCHTRPVGRVGLFFKNLSKKAVNMFKRNVFRSQSDWFGISVIAIF